MRKVLILLTLALLGLPLMAQESTLNNDAVAISPQTGSNAGPESLSDDITQHPLFLESLEWRAKAQTALTEGNYAQSIEYSTLGIKALDKFKGNNGILLAEQQLRLARERGFDSKFPEEYQQAVDYVESAKDKLAMGDFTGSVSDSDRALSILKAMFANAGINLVTQYTVVPGNSMWRIAANPEIYNDKHAWPKIYMANKERLRQPDNPHLIFPGQVFDIPR
jgi:nucleoid-associated protein YgaU